jgi:hypothetical protein
MVKQVHDVDFRERSIPIPVDVAELYLGSRTYRFIHTDIRLGPPAEYQITGPLLATCNLHTVSTRIALTRRTWKHI